MDQACGEVSREIATLESGEWGRRKDMVFMCGSMEIVIKEISNHVLNMGKGHKNLRMEIFIKESTQEENQMGMGSTIGLTEAISKEDSRTD